MITITDKQRIEAAKKLGISSAVSKNGQLVLTTSKEDIVAGRYGYWYDPDNTVFPDTKVSDCPDWKKSLRDENGNKVIV